MKDQCNIAFREVVLTGFKGSGKSRVGKALAKSLGFTFLDLDTVIEEKWVQSGHPKATVRTIYKKNGKEFFEKMEAASLSHVSSLKGYVLSLGGGTPLNESFSKRDFSRAVFVHLTVKPEVLYGRIKSKGLPPFVDPKRPKASLMELIEKREPYYKKIADISVNNTSRNVSDVVKEIIEKLEKV